MKILKIVFKSLGVFFGGAVFGIVVMFIFFLKPTLNGLAIKKVGLGVIALAPALMLIYGVVFTFGGGLLGLVFYYGIKIFRKYRIFSNLKSQH